MCNKCGASKCGCSSNGKTTATGKQGKIGPRGPRGPAGNSVTGPPFVPLVYNIDRNPLTTLSSGTLTIDDPACQFASVPAGKYLVMFEANISCNRDTEVAENLDVSVYINGNLLRRTHTVHDWKKQISLKAVTTGVLTFAVTTNVKVNYMITSTFPTVSGFPLNPSTSVNIQTGSFTLIKMN
jgi:hypothetical protein